MAAASLSS